MRERYSENRKKDENKPTIVVNKETDAEDWCFVCKDGGELVICDYGDCLKVYHSRCVKKDESCSEIGEGWTCDRHICMVCCKTPKFQCLCCPSALCKKCFHHSEFLPIQFDSGLCGDCLELVLLGEDEEAYDMDGVLIDFKDRNTHEGLFKEYWDIIMEQEGLTMDDIHAANDEVKKKKSRKRGSVSGKTGKCRDNDDCWEILETDEDELKIHKSSGKRKISKKKEFDGWASKPLIAFLQSIGKDTTESLSLSKVDSIVKGYIQEKKLADPSRKYRVCCDERLRLLFSRNNLVKSRIFYLLESHLEENIEASGENMDDDDDDDDEDDNDDACNIVDAYELGKKKERDTFVAPKKQRVSSSAERSEKKNFDVFFKPSCFASVISENIKLIYLRRSLVEDFYKQPEKFEEKVVGSFIRVKTEAGDGKQRNSHQILPVTGIEKSTTGEIFLKVSSLPKSLSIHMLSDSDFTEEECKDLQEKIENGGLKKLTVVELQEKANSLHEDVMKHWIKRKLILLQHSIDYANEKGRRRELFDHIELKELLKKPEEQERLLKKLPRVVPEVVELKSVSDSDVVEIVD